MFGKNKIEGFLSYRNINIGGNYPNYALVQNLAGDLEKKGYGSFGTIPPEAIPPDSLFSAYSVAEFLSHTFTILDSIKHFVILDSYYFEANGELTSIWTEAECCLWSYYDRNMLLSPYRKMDKFFIIASPSPTGNQFQYREHSLLELDDQARVLLKTASMDFQGGLHGGGRSMQQFYKKFSHLYVLTCYGCDKTTLIDATILGNRSKQQKPYMCKCGNQIHVKHQSNFYTAKQDAKRKRKALSLFQIMALIYGNESPFSIVEE